MYKTGKSIVLLLFLLSCQNTPAHHPDTRAQVNEARGLVKQFAGTLKPMLVEHLKKDGPTGAIRVCREAAPRIARELSERSGWIVKRVSHRARNKDTAVPDAWETKVLQKFLALREKGSDADTLEYHEMIRLADGTEEFRYMKAQKTLKLCLTCHGKNVSPDVLQSLNTLYPEDAARGFELGDVRGAFSLTFKPDDGPKRDSN